MHRLVSLTVLASALLVGCDNRPEPRPHAVESSAPANSAAASSQVVDLVSGVSLGPVRVGMDRAELSTLGLPVKSIGGKALEVGPYSVFLEDGRVTSIDVELAKLPGVRIGGKVFTAGGGTDMAAIAPSLPGCGPVRTRLGGNAMICDGARTVLLGVGSVTLQVNAPKQAAEEMERDRRSYGAEKTPPPSDALWKHPGMNMSLRHPSWLEVHEKPDGASLQSKPLAEVENRSTDTGPRTKATPFVILVSVGHGKLFEVMKRAGVTVDLYFPTGREDSFKAGAGDERVTVAGKPGYSLFAADHDQHADRVFAEVAPGWTVEVQCRYVADLWKPRVPESEQAAACKRVIGTLTFDLR
ncbi:MAG: hypothetical protein QM820_06250 [Minicystis sp.]